MPPVTVLRAWLVVALGARWCVTVEQNSKLRVPDRRTRRRSQPKPSTQPCFGSVSNLNWTPGIFPKIPHLNSDKIWVFWNKFLMPVWINFEIFFAKNAALKIWRSDAVNNHASCMIIDPRVESIQQCIFNPGQTRWDNKQATEPWARTTLNVPNDSNLSIKFKYASNLFFVKANRPLVGPYLGHRIISRCPLHVSYVESYLS